MKKSMKRYLAMLLAMTLVLQQGGTITLADEKEPASETVVEKTTEAKPSEKKAEENKPEEKKPEETKEPESKAPETKPEAPKTEENKTAETKSEETNAPDAQTGTQTDDATAEPESNSEKATEQVTESETATEPSAETTEPASGSEPEKETKAEKEAEAGPTLLEAECNGVGVSVSAAPGVLKAGTTLEMIPTGKNQVYQAVLPLMDKNTEIDKTNFLAFDITLMLDGQEVQPDGEVTVSFTNVPFAAGENEEIIVAHLNDAPAANSSTNTISAFRAMPGAASAEIASGLSMKTTHFSIYAVCVLKKHYEELQSEADAETDPSKREEKKSEADKYKQYEDYADEDGKYQPQNSFSFEYVDENGQTQTFTSPAFDFHIFADSVDFTNHTNGNIAANHLNAHGQAFGTNQKTSGTYEKDGVQYTGDGLLEYNYFGEEVTDASGTIASGRTVLGSGVTWDATSDNNVTVGDGNKGSQDGNKIYQAEGESEGDAKTGENSDKYIDIVDELNRLKTLSKELAKKDTSTGVSLTPAPDVPREGDVLNQHIKIDVTNCTDTVNYLNVNAKDLLNGNSKPELDLIGVKDKTIVINVNMAGLTETQLAQFRCLTPTIEGCTNGEDLVRQNCNVLWNFYYQGESDTSPQTFDMSDSIYGAEGDKYLDLSGGDWFMGTVLAPGANVKYGAHNGSIIAQKAQSTGKESHNWRYTGQSASVTVKKVLSAPGEMGDRTFYFAVFLDEAGTIRDQNQFVKSVTVTAPDGTGTVTFSDLKVDKDYYIYETDASGKRITQTAEGYFVSGGGLVHSSHEKSNVVEITNSKEEKEDGSLSVSKTVAGNAGDQTKAFNFTVTLSDTSVNGEYGDMKFTNGVASFTLEHGETKTATGLPKGLSYTVTEESEDYTVTKTGDTGTIPAGGTATASFTNTKNVFGSLTVTKTFAGDLEAKDLTPKQKEAITFEITGPNYKKTLTYKDIEEGKGALKDLAPGEYVVKETNGNVDGYTVETKYSVTDGKATVEAEKTATVEVTNTYTQKKGSLTVAKTFAGDLTAEDLTPEQKEAITFEITGPNYKKTLTYKDIEEGKGALKDLVPGEYTVTETNGNVDGYTVETKYSVGEDGKTTVEAEKTATVEVTNTYTQKKGALKIKKNVTVNGAATTGSEADGIYKFEVKDADGNKVGNTVELTVKNGASVEKTVSDLVPGTYTVSELTDNLKDGMSLTSDNNVTVTVTADTTATVETAEFTNNQVVVKVSIKKIDNTGKALAGAKLIIKDAAGNPVDSWTTNGKPHEITGLKKGTYTLSELEAPEGYQVSKDMSFEITGKEENGAVIEVEMTDQPVVETKRSLRVTKELSMEGISPEAHIIVRSATYYVALFKDPEKTERVTDVKKIVFANQESSYATFDNLEKDVTYYVGETDEYGTLIPSRRLENLIYYPTYDDNSTFKFEGDTMEGLAGFTNVYIEWPDYFYLSGQLTVTKQVLLGGEECDSDDTFYARVFKDAKLTDPVSDEVLVLDMAGGSRTSVTVTNLPIGDKPGSSRKYYVAETDEYGNPLDPDEVTEYTISVDKSEITLDASNANPEVVITNDFHEEESEFESESEVDEKKTAPKTGEDTDYAKYLFLLTLSAGTCAVLFGEKRRKAKRVRK